MNTEIIADVLVVLTDYVFSVLMTIAATLVVHCFFDDEIQVTKKKAIVIAAVYGAFELAFNILRRIVGGEAIDSGTFVVYLVGGIIAAWGPKTRRIRRSLFLTLVMVMCMMVCFVIAQMCIYLAGVRNLVSYDSVEEATGQFNFTNLFAILYVLVIILYLMKQYVRKGRVMPFRRSDKVFTALYLVYIVCMEAIYVKIEQNSPGFARDYKSINIFTAVVTIGIALLIPVLILRNRQTDYFNRLSEQHQNFLEAELAASKQFREAQEETRAFRHDVQNNLSVVSMLMNEGKFAEAEQYINDMHTHVSSLSPKIVTGDEMLDSLIAVKMAKINEAGIDLTIDGVADGGIGWKPIDICTVFANALDNAIEACERIEEKEKRFIRLEIRKTAHQRLITIANSSAEDVDCEKLLHSDMHVTSKEDKMLHGYGVRNIRRTIEKYGGMLRVSCIGGQFKLEMILGISSVE
ncbi:GHKL domain-containing protein [Ruminococcus sp.]|uniref:sensor histidine kinase n=1 Tax=Ruminococcus sp. TaxID=41978 RepID=UPI0025F1DFA6|nr:GHKL domain-containing protein [Ruminococcus sp.]MBQ8965844.1 GHKL domain-containing protein [Ruminococcus sp.]